MTLEPLPDGSSAERRVLTGVACVRVRSPTAPHCASTRSRHGQALRSDRWPARPLPGSLDPFARETVRPCAARRSLAAFIDLEHRRHVEGLGSEAIALVTSERMLHSPRPMPEVAWKRTSAESGSPSRIEIDRVARVGGLQVDVDEAAPSRPGPSRRPARRGRWRGRGGWMRPAAEPATVSSVEPAECSGSPNSGSSASSGARRPLGQLDPPGEERQRHRLGRGPGPGPVGRARRPARSRWPAGIECASRRAGRAPRSGARARAARAARGSRGA